MSTGGTVPQLYKYPEYMPEPYEREREFRRRDREAHIALMKDKPNLKLNSPGGKDFATGR